MKMKRMSVSLLATFSFLIAASSVQLDARPLDINADPEVEQEDINPPSVVPVQKPKRNWICKLIVTAVEVRLICQRVTNIIDIWDEEEVEEPDAQSDGSIQSSARLIVRDQCIVPVDLPGYAFSNQTLEVYSAENENLNLRMVSSQVRMSHSDFLAAHGLHVNIDDNSASEAMIRTLANSSNIEQALGSWLRNESEACFDSRNP